MQRDDVLARELLAAAMPLDERRGLTLIGVAVSNLEADGGAGQLALPLDRPTAPAVDEVLDDVRERFGPGALTRAKLLRDGAVPDWTDLDDP